MAGPLFRAPSPLGQPGIWDQPPLFPPIAIPVWRSWTSLPYPPKADMYSLHTAMKA